MADPWPRADGMWATWALLVRWYVVRRLQVRFVSPCLTSVRGMIVCTRGRRRGLLLGQFASFMCEYVFYTRGLSSFGRNFIGNTCF